MRFPGWGAQREPPYPAPPSPRWGRQPRPSPNPARKLARLEKNARRKMSRSRKREKERKKNTPKKKNLTNPRLERVAGGPGPAGRAARRGGCGRGHCREAGRSEAVPPSPAQASKAAGRSRPPSLSSPERFPNKCRSAACASVRAGSEGGGDRPAPQPRQRGGESAALRSAVLIEATAGKRLGTWESDRVCAAKQVTGGCCKCSRA